MKLKLWIMLALLTNGVTYAASPEGERVQDLYWNHYPGGTPTLPWAPPSPPWAKIEFDSPLNPESPEAISLKITYTGSGPAELKLLPVEHYRQLEQGVVREVRTHHYAITGNVRYENASPGSYLEMLSYFASATPGFPEAAYFTRTLAESGPMQQLGGTSDWRPFALPFDSTGEQAPLSRLEIHLHLTGPGTVHLRNMKLMQYPDPEVTGPHISAQPSHQASELVVSASSGPDHGTIFTMGGVDYSSIAEVQQQMATAHQSNPQVAILLRVNKDLPYPEVVRLLDAAKDAGIANIAFATEPPSPSAPSPNGLSWRSFLLGIAVTGALLAAVGGVIFLSRRLNRSRHERELRRIASLDS